MIIPIDVKPPKRVEKLWGYELWIHNDEEYCGKLLVFEKKMANFSMHYHLKKKETWYIQQGSFQFNWIDVEEGLHDSRILKVGDSVCVVTALKLPTANKLVDIIASLTDKLPALSTALIK